MSRGCKSVRENQQREESIYFSPFADFLFYLSSIVLELLKLM